MLDDLIAGVAPIGGVQPFTRQAQLVDHADERTGSHGRPDAQDSEPHDPAPGLGDDDRRGGDVEEVAEEVDVIAPAFVIGPVRRQQSDGGIEIGRSGVADESLQRGPQRGFGRAIGSRCCWTTRAQDTTTAVEPFGEAGGTDREALCSTYCAAQSAAAMMPRP